jgi:hypothetical protein
MAMRAALASAHQKVVRLTAHFPRRRPSAGVPVSWARIGEAVGHGNLMTTARTYTDVLSDEAELDYEALLAA